ncbi:hypothetical protein [Allochromatium palmeri]|uniref:CRISPR-associated Cas3 subtype I-F/YPEST-like C-terminal domain-containing protein n=1 Tax=Allochromatium palmeri TaxID=231048 RepID=A0A6N8EK56_9GAMM|nr:hypothetical protein [Allochromatium palmeri]MTW22907.1 hypothetical protein [Allochromatium palmeri]
MRERSREHGAFIVNMASTGCGKTLGNARIMYALADPALGMRCAFAMGLRTLTLQTGKAFRDMLALSDDDLAIRVGGSATLPPALVQGLFEAYRNGRQHFQLNRAARPTGAETPPAICCAWMDEFHQQAQDCSDAASFAQTHGQFARRRHGELARLAAKPRRRAAVRPVQGLQGIRPIPLLAQAFAPQVLSAAINLHHDHHSVDPETRKRVSFGLVRMANIEPFPRDITLTLLPDEDDEKALLHQVMDGGRRGENLYIPVDRSQCEHLPDTLVRGDRIEPWGITDYMAALSALASELELSPATCAERFGTATVRPNDNGWRYHPVLGFAQKR